MKVIFVITDIKYGGGGERVVSSLSNYFVENLKYEVEIISLINSDKTQSYYFNEEIKIHYLDMKVEKNLIIKKIYNRISNIFVMRKKMKKLIKSDDKNQKIKVIGIGFENSWTLPLIFSKEKYDIYGTQHTNFKENNLLKNLLWKIFLKKLNKFIVLTEDAQIFFKDFLGNKVLVIPNPNPYKQEEKFYSKEKIALVVGRIDKNKQINQAIEIWEQLMKKTEGWKLYILGDGEERKKLEKFVKEKKLEDSVKFVGRVSNIKDYYEKASLIFSTSKSEAFPMIYIEGATFKVPHITYRSFSGLDKFLKDGETGYIIENFDENYFIEKAEFLMKNEKIRTEMGENNFEKVKGLRIENIAQKWKTLLEGSE